MSRQKNSILINEHPLNCEPVPSRIILAYSSAATTKLSIIFLLMDLISLLHNHVICEMIPKGNVIGE